MEQLAAKPEAHGHAHAHPPHLAHHFDTPEQQYRTGKIGMWIFLGTEILMFGGLFLAYSVYRYNYPEIFLYSANRYLDTKLGAINTVVLIASSLTMALAVRYAQLNRQRALITCLLLTILGGVGFMVIKANEYEHKYHEHVFVSQWLNKYNPTHAHEQAAGQEAGAEAAAAEAPATAQVDPRVGLVHFDPNAGTQDAAKITPRYVAPTGLVSQQGHAGHGVDYESLNHMAQKRLYVFFQIYFLMTGLHGIHVIIGMGLIFWIALRAVAPKWRLTLGSLAPALIGAYVIYVGALTHTSTTQVIGGVFLALAVLMLLGGLARARKLATGRGDFSDEYFTPVDLVGLYWHLVDLIWIFLFPLLYLIH